MLWHVAQMLIGFMIGGALLGALHRLGMAGRIPSYGIESMKPQARLMALAFFAVCIAPYAATPMGFALMLLCFFGAWKVAAIVVDVTLEYI